MVPLFFVSVTDIGDWDGEWCSTALSCNARIQILVVRLITQKKGGKIDHQTHAKDYRNQVRLGQNRSNQIKTTFQKPKLCTYCHNTQHLLTAQ